jgi:putative tryptophan/tyrosine transport system substrate-binding protein
MRRREFITLLGGTAATWPLATRAQELPVIGFMSGRSPEDSAHLVKAFQEGLAEVGFAAGQNVTIEYRWARGQYDKLPALAAELVNLRVAVLAAVGGDASALAAKQATATIPIVFGIGGDPVGAGLVKSLNRPGGNATGYTLLTGQMESKRVGLLQELVPNGLLFGVLLNPNYPISALQLKDIEESAKIVGRQLFVARATNDTELDAAFASLRQRRVDALLVTADPYFDTRRERIIALAADGRLPAMYQLREYAVAGGLISYGPNINDGYRQAGVYAGQILKGSKPDNLPVVQPTKFQFVINLKTAKALGLKVSANLLSFADEVIE